MYKLLYIVFVFFIPFRLPGRQIGVFINQRDSHDFMAFSSRKIYFFLI